MSESRNITMPWPPTANTYWRRVGPKTLISQVGRKYRRTIKQLALAERWPQFGKQRVWVYIGAWPPDNRRRDLDNLLKATLDSLEHAGVFDDDGQIDMISIERRSAGPRRGQLAISITPAP